MQGIIASVVMVLAVAAHAHYERCDDLCRVLGYDKGGVCVEEQCLCNPEEVDVTEVLPAVCKV